MKQVKFTSVTYRLLGALLLLGALAPMAFTSCGKDPDTPEPDIPGKMKLIPPEDIIIKWDYKSYDDISDTLIAKIQVPDGKRDKFVGCDQSLTWNTATKTDYTQGTGAVTSHTTDKTAIDLVLVSGAEYGLKDSTYVYSIQKYDAADDLTYTGEFNYIVKARPADAVIDLGTYNMACSNTNTKIAIYPINAVYAFHKAYYSRYPIGEFGSDFVKDAVFDLTLFSLDGEIVNVVAFFALQYASSGETSYLSLPMKKPGKWEVSATTHFANVRYTFVVTVNVI